MLSLDPSCEGGKHCFQHVYGQYYDTFVVCAVLLDPISLVRDHRVKEVLTAEGVTVRSFNADLLYEPWEVLDQDGRPFNTFSGFWDRCLSMPYDPEAPLLPPKRIFPGTTHLQTFYPNYILQYHLLSWSELI